jgi:CAAX prenyl protease-like protein
MAFVAIQSWPDAGRTSEGEIRWLVLFRGVAVAAVLGIFWRAYDELHLAPNPRPAEWGLAIASGAAVFLAWIALDFPPFALEPGRGFSPLDGAGRIDPFVAALRLAGMALVVPVMEELFWRSFFMRWIDRKDFLTGDPRVVSPLAVVVSSALFASEHSEWFAGLLAGTCYALLYRRSANLWVPTIAHGTTNALLGTWILATQSWRHW